MKFMWLPLLSALASIAAQGDEPRGIALVDSHKIGFTEPARRVPAQNMVDGPLLGNGDVGVVVAGPPDALRFHIGKNDFWGIRTQAPMTVGSLQLNIPELASASYRAECDMRRAQWTGFFVRDNAALSARAWVDACANRFFVELFNTGAVPLHVAVHPVRGGSAAAVLPRSVRNTETPLLAGCEQHGRRWFFNGEMADLSVRDKVLASAEIAALARTPRGVVQAFDGRTSVPFSAPVVSNALTISGWIRIAGYDPKEANYIVSKGEWNQAFSLGLSGGHLRFAIDGVMLQSDQILPTNAWLHVAAVFEGGKRMEMYLDGRRAMQVGDEGAGGMSFAYDPDAGQPNARTLGFAARILGGSSNAVAIAPGASAIVASAILTDLDARDSLPAARREVDGLTPVKVARAFAAHKAWWEKFWMASFVEIPDKVIEQHWYSTQYIMASCSRAGKVAPGLWGNWITRDDTFWHGDFHLNYNFQAPFYSLYSANHPEVSLPFYDAMVQSIPRGRAIAARHGWMGVQLPVSIGPWGLCPEGDDCDWGQRSNAAYAALNFIWYYQYTQDTRWLRTTGYPYLREVEKFWTDYLKRMTNADGCTRYVIEHDAIHEGSGGAGRSGISSDFNPILSLGLVRTLYRNLLTMSEDLGADADLRPHWKDILEKISDWPLQERNGRTVFRYTEQGTPWWSDNTLGIQHIFPCCAIGFESDPKLLEISRNMLDAMGRWTDYNGASSWYTACARVGYQPEKILKQLRAMYDGHSMPNKLLYFGGGGIENASPSLAVNEMLLQSYEGVIRLFPCWPADLDARFGSLRAVGAFLVSAEIKGGVVGGVRILSEKGRRLTVQNPWAGKAVQVVRNGRMDRTMTGARLVLATKPGEVIELSPEK